MWARGGRGRGRARKGGEEETETETDSEKKKICHIIIHICHIIVHIWKKTRKQRLTARKRALENTRATERRRVGRENTKSECMHAPTRESTRTRAREREKEREREREREREGGREEEREKLAMQNGSVFPTQTQT